MPLVGQPTKPEIEHFLRFIPAASEDRRSFTAPAKVALSFYNEECHLYVDQTQQFVLPDTSLMQGVLTVPIIPNITERAVSSMFSEEAIFEAVSIGTTTEELMCQQAAQSFLDEFARRNPVFENNISTARDLMITGKAFQRLYMDWDWVPVVMSGDLVPVYLQMLTEEQKSRGNINFRPQIREADAVRQPNGEWRIPMFLPVVREMNVSSFGTLVNSSATDLEDASDFVCHEIWHIDRAKTTYADSGFDFDKLTGRTIADKMVPHDNGMVGTSWYGSSRGQQTGDSFSASANLVRWFDCWRKLAPGQWYHAVLIQDGRGFHLIKEEQAPFHNYVDYRWRHVNTYFWDKSLVFPATNIARAFTVAATKLQQNFQESMKDVVLAPAGAKKQLTNAIGTVVEVDPRYINSIKRLDMAQGAHQNLLSLMQNYQALCYDIMGFSDISRGITQTHTTTGALQIARKADLGPIATARTIYDKTQARVKLPKVLRMMREYVDAPRLYVPSGGSESAQIMQKVLRGKDLGGVYDVQVVGTQQVGVTQAERIEQGLALATAGVFQSAQDFDDYARNQRRTLPMQSTEGLERTRARVENQWISEGLALSTGMAVDPMTGQARPTPVIYASPNPPIDGLPNPNYGMTLVRPTDIHELHIEEHERAEREGQVPRAALETHRFHILEHRLAMRQEQMDALAQQVEMEMKLSYANQAPQITMQQMSAEQKAQSETRKMKATPADGGRKSGAVRRSQAA